MTSDQPCAGLFYGRVGVILASQRAALDLDPDARDGQPLGGQVNLQAGQQLPQFCGHGIGADQQAPLPIVDGAGLNAAPQGNR